MYVKRKKMPFLMQAAVYYAFKLKLPLYGGIMAVVPAS
jgi:hypothetical protein